MKEYHYFCDMKEMKLYFDEKLKSPDPISIIACSDYISTRNAISNDRPCILTNQSHFITRDLILNGYEVIVHHNMKEIKITKNTQVGSEYIKTMKGRQSMEKYVLKNILEFE